MQMQSFGVLMQYFSYQKKKKIPKATLLNCCRPTKKSFGHPRKAIQEKAVYIKENMKAHFTCRL